MIQILPYDPKNPEAVLSRAAYMTGVADTVAAILAEVREDGDEALYRLAQRFDGGRPEALEVSKQAWDEAWNQADPQLVAVLQQAAANIREFHTLQLRQGFALQRPDGSTLGQRVLPLQRVGLYIPGGTAAYPSTVLMNGIPASVAGVEEIIMVSPAKSGRVNPDLLVAARIAGVNRVFAIGGAQAVAALAYGTQSIPCVDKIVGPGNAYVAEAKRQIFGQCGIDMIAGPSEILIVADENADPEKLAADLLSQAEHDRNAAAVLITHVPALAQAVAQAVERQLAQLPREEIARASIDSNGKIILTKDLDQALALANTLAPEHLELCVSNPFEWLERVRNAGSVFLGYTTPEAIGDYWAGANHTLPTGGTARFSSALGVDDFIHKVQYISYTPAAAAAAAECIAYFARKEGLEGHARSALSRA